MRSHYTIDTVRSREENVLTSHTVVIIVYILKDSHHFIKGAVHVCARVCNIIMKMQRVAIFIALLDVIMCYSRA